MNSGVNAMGMSMNQQLRPGQVQEGVGVDRTQYAQAQTSADKARFDFMQQEEENYIDRFFGRSNNTPAGGTTQVGREGTWEDILAGFGAGTTAGYDIFGSPQQGTQVPAPTPIIPQNT